MGVVTGQEIHIAGALGAHLLESRTKIRCSCLRCPRSAPDYDLDPARLRRVLKDKGARLRVQVLITDVATEVDVRGTSSHRV
jgi:hypothetical protein